MPETKFNAKKTFWIRFADGQVKKIVGYEYDEQKENYTIWIRPGHFKKAKPISLPKSSIIGFGQSNFIMKGGTFCFCCHTYDSNGTEIVQGSDDLTTLTMQIIDYEKNEKFLRDQINTLQCSVEEFLKTREGITDAVASDFKKIIEPVIAQVKQPRMRGGSYRQDYYPMDVAPPEEELENEQ